MCLIAIKKQGSKLPKEKHLRAAERRNPDGIGVMTWKPGEKVVRIKKDFKNVGELLEWQAANVKEEDIYVVHFRYATHGVKDAGNRHPFPVTQEKELLRKTNLSCSAAVAHNGVLSNVPRHQLYSDTQKFVLSVLGSPSIINNIADRAVQLLIADFIGGDRVVVLLGDGSMYRFGNWVKKGGILYSNEGFISYEYTKPKKDLFNYWNRRPKAEEWDELEEAPEECPVEPEIQCEECGCQTDVLTVLLDGKQALICKTCRDRLQGEGLYRVEDLVHQMSTKTEVRCEGCLTWFPKKETQHTIYGRMCHQCAEGLRDM